MTVTTLRMKFAPGLVASGNERQVPRPRSGVDLTSYISGVAAEIIADGGGCAVLPAGTWYTAAQDFGSASNLHIRGNGPGATTLIPTSLTETMFTFGQGPGHAAVANVGASDILIQGVQSAGSAIKFYNVEGGYLNRFHCHGQFNPVLIDTALGIFIDQGRITSTTASTGNGIIVQGNNGDIFLSNLFLDNASGTKANAGIYVVETGGIWLDTIEIHRFGSGLVLAPTSGKECDWIFADRVCADTSTNAGFLLSPSAGGVVCGAYFNQCWSSSTESGYGVRLEGAGTIEDVSFLHHRAVANGLDGFSIQTGTDIEIAHGMIRASGISSAGTYAGIDIAAGLSGIRLHNNRIKGTLPPIQGFNTSTQYHRHAIKIGSGAGDYITIKDNDLRGYATSAISNGATGLNNTTTPNIT